MKNSKFIGTWKLLSLESRTEDGQVAHPLGKEVIGYILLTQNRISCQYRLCNLTVPYLLLVI